MRIWPEDTIKIRFVSVVSYDLLLFFGVRRIHPKLHSLGVELYNCLLGVLRDVART